MAKAEEHYDKIALGVGAVVLLAAAWFAYSGYSQSQGEFDHHTPPSKDLKPIPEEILIVDSSQKLNGEVKVEEQEVNDKAVKLFTGANRYVIKGKNGKLEALDPEGAVHPPMKNGWFFENEIEIGWKDAPERDPDGDGFTNREEHDAKTNPNDITSTPPLLEKLAFLKVETFIFELQLGGLSGDTAQFRYRDNKNRGQVQRTRFIPMGSQLFDQSFFKLKEIKESEVKNPSTNSMTKVKIAVVEQLQGPQKGRLLSIQHRANPAPQFKEFTAVLTLNAVAESGNQFKVPDNGRFSLPYKAEASEEEKKYTLKFSADGKKISIEGDGGKVELDAP